MNTYLLLSSLPTVSTGATAGAPAAMPLAAPLGGEGAFAGLLGAWFAGQPQPVAPPNGLLWKPMAAEGNVVSLRSAASPTPPAQLLLGGSGQESPTWQVVVATAASPPQAAERIAVTGRQDTTAPATQPAPDVMPTVPTGRPLRVKIEIPVSPAPTDSAPVAWASSPRGPAPSRTESAGQPVSAADEPAPVVQLALGEQVWTLPAIQRDGALYVQLPPSLWAAVQRSSPTVQPAMQAVPVSEPPPSAAPWLAFVPAMNGAVQVEVVSAPPAATTVQPTVQAETAPPKTVPLASWPLDLRPAAVAGKVPIPIAPGSGLVGRVELPFQPKADGQPAPSNPGMPEGARLKQAALARLGLGLLPQTDAPTPIPVPSVPDLPVPLPAPPPSGEVVLAPVLPDTGPPPKPITPAAPPPTLGVPTPIAPVAGNGPVVPTMLVVPMPTVPASGGSPVVPIAPPAANPTLVQVASMPTVPVTGNGPVVPVEPVATVPPPTVFVPTPAAPPSTVAVETSPGPLPKVAVQAPGDPPPTAVLPAPVAPISSNGPVVSVELTVDAPPPQAPAIVVATVPPPMPSAGANATIAVAPQTDAPVVRPGAVELEAAPPPSVSPPVAAKPVAIAVVSAPTTGQTPRPVVTGQEPKPTEAPAIPSKPAAPTRVLVLQPQVVATEPSAPVDTPAPQKPVRVLPAAPSPANQQPVARVSDAPTTPVVKLVGVRQTVPERVQVELQLEPAPQQPAETVPVFARLPVLSPGMRLRMATTENAMTETVSQAEAPKAMTKGAPPPVEKPADGSAPQVMAKQRPALPAPEPPAVMAAVEEKAQAEPKPDAYVVKAAGQTTRVLSNTAMAEQINATPSLQPEQPAVKPAERANGQPKLAADAFAQGKPDPAAAQASASAEDAVAERPQGQAQPAEFRVVAVASQHETTAGGERIVTTPTTVATTTPAAVRAGQAPAPAVSTVPAPPTSAETDALGQIVQNARLLSETGRHTLTVQLVPEHLGRLEIRLVQEGDRVTTQILAHEARTEQLLSRNFDQLHRMLESAGLKVQQVVVLAAHSAAPVSASQEPAPAERHAPSQEQRQGAEQQARQGGHERRGGQRQPFEWKEQEWWG